MKNKKSLFLIGLSVLSLVFAMSCKNPASPEAEDENVTVKFDSAEGTAVESITVKKGEAITAPVAPTKDGFIFGDWYTEANGAGTKWDFADVVNKNMTLYAKWDKACVVKFNDGETTLETVTVRKGDVITATPEAPTKESFIFNHWDTSKEDGGSVWNSATAVEEDMTVYAKWDAVEMPAALPVILYDAPNGTIPQNKLCTSNSVTITNNGNKKNEFIVKVNCKDLVVHGAGDGGATRAKPHHLL